VLGRAENARFVPNPGVRVAAASCAIAIAECGPLGPECSVHTRKQQWLLWRSAVRVEPMVPSGSYS
jgi:hypothetical protein